MAKCYHKNNDSKKKYRLVTVSDRDRASAKRREYIYSPRHSTSVPSDRLSCITAHAVWSYPCSEPFQKFCPENPRSRSRSRCTNLPLRHTGKVTNLKLRTNVTSHRYASEKKETGQKIENAYVSQVRVKRDSVIDPLSQCIIIRLWYSWIRQWVNSQDTAHYFFASPTKGGNFPLALKFLLVTLTFFKTWTSSQLCFALLVRLLGPKVNFGDSCTLRLPQERRLAKQVALTRIQSQFFLLRAVLTQTQIRNDNLYANSFALTSSSNECVLHLHSYTICAQTHSSSRVRVLNL